MQGITPFAGSPQFTLQQVIDRRYQVLETLSQRQWERTYLAIDTQTAEQPLCVVREFCLHHNSPQTLQAVKARYEYEKSWMTALGRCDQVAQLLDLIVTEHAVYLVREFVVGEPVAWNETVGDRWNEQQVLAFLLDVLTVLQFAHSKAGIHGNLHPGNLIRRESDGRFVLTDVCAISPIGMLLAEVKISEGVPKKLDRLGYFAREQLWQRPRPSSDLFSLGMIGVGLLTGLQPWDIPRHSKTGQLLWRTVGAKEHRLTEALTYMTQDHYRDRAQSAHEVLAILNSPVPVQQFIQKIRQKRQNKTAGRYSQDKRDKQKLDLDPSKPVSAPPISPSASASSKATPAGLERVHGAATMAIAASALIVVGGSFALATHPGALLWVDTASKTLQQAEQRYQRGDVEGAIALAGSISPQSAAFPVAQASMQNWQQEWDRATQLFSELETAYKSQQWLTVLRKGRAIVPTEFWTAQLAPFINHAQTEVDQQGHESLQGAFELAYQYQFAEALDALRRIPPESSAYVQVPAKFAEYEEKRNIRAQYYLQQAYDEAQTGNFMQAIAFLQRITPESSCYAIAQGKQLEYAEKVRLQTRSPLQPAPGVP